MSHQTPPHGKQSAPIQIQLSDDELSDAGSEHSLGDWTNPKATSSPAAPYVSAVNPHAVSVVEAEEPGLFASHHSRSSMPQYNSQNNNSRGLMDSFGESQEIRFLAKELDAMEKSMEDFNTSREELVVVPISSAHATPNNSAHSSAHSTPNQPKRRTSRGLRQSTHHGGRNSIHTTTSSSNSSHHSHHSSSNYSSEYSKDYVDSSDSKDINKQLVSRRPDEDVLIASPSCVVATPSNTDSVYDNEDQQLSGYTLHSSPYSGSDNNHVITPIATIAADDSGRHSRSSYHDSRGSTTMDIIDMLLEEGEEEDSEHYGKQPPPPKLPPLNHNSHNDLSMTGKDQAIQDLEDRAVVKTVATNKIKLQPTKNGNSGGGGGRGQQGGAMQLQEDPTEEPTDRTVTVDSEGISDISSKRTLSIGEIMRTPKMRRTLMCLVCFILILVVGVVVATVVVLGGGGGGDGSSNSNNDTSESPSNGGGGGGSTIIPVDPASPDGTTTTPIVPPATVGTPSLSPTSMPSAAPSESAPTPAPLATFPPAPGESGVNYRTTYQARFQHLLDDNCVAPDPPLLRLFCRGTITLLSTSDTRITCSDFSQSAGWNGLECTTTCGTDEECTQVYLERSAIQAGIFGQVEFTCDGTEASDVDSYLHYVGGPNGSCDAAGGGGQNGRNFHVAQLGIECPTNSQTARFDYDDYFFEGGLDGLNFVGQFDNRYTVYDGTNCAGSACDVRYDDVFIQAESHNFHHCIQPVGSGVTVPPAQSMEQLRLPSDEGFTYSVQFEANWRALIDGNHCSRSTTTNAPARITCLDNAQISLVETQRASTTCEPVGDSVLECTDSMGGTSYTGVVYSCTGSSLPETHVEYLPQEVSCTQQTSPEVLLHNLKMGIHCNQSGGSLVSRFDYFFECGRTDDFTTLDGADDFTCLSTAEVPAGSTDDVTIPSTEMYTNYQWSRSASTLGGCFTQTAAP